MNDKIEITVNKTIDALDRIERFIEKYGVKLSNKQIDNISKKLKDLQNKVDEV